MDLKQPIARAAPFRGFVCACLIAEAGWQFALAGERQLILLALALLLWLILCRLAQQRDRASTAFVLHLVEAALLPGLLNHLPAITTVATLLLVLAGSAASGGWRFLLPCAGVMLLNTAPVRFSGLDLLMPWIMLSGFLVALSLVSFAQAQRLYRHGSQARRRSEQLDLTNSHLEKYLPPLVRERIRLGGVSRELPHSCWVSVAFIDLVGFSAYVRQRPAAEIVAVVDGYQAQINQLVISHGGVLGKFLGDGALVYFPERGNRALNARHCLLMLKELPLLLDELNGRWRQQGHLVQLQVRIGVASGYCALGDWGGDSVDRLDHCIIGDCVNLAARLQQAADPGEGLICEVTAAMIQGQRGNPEPDRFLGERRCITLKGLGETPVYPLVDAGEGHL